jgi:hypothetical protein
MGLRERYFGSSYELLSHDKVILCLFIYFYIFLLWFAGEI